MKQKWIPAQTREILNKYGITLKKSLGQNFLTDLHVLDKIVRAANLTETSGVIEIGPGIGALTEQLAKVAKKVVAIEIDHRLIPVLNDLFKETDNIEVIHGDALKVDLHQLIQEHFQDVQSLHVVANLPYYVTSPLITRLLEGRLPLKNMVLMIQKEVADRLIAHPGTKDYGSLSVFVQYFAEPSGVARVPSHVFVPRPKVDSSVVKLHIREKPNVQVINEDLFFRVVRAAFGQRRKTLLNTLHTRLLSNVSKTEVENLITSAGIDPKRRGETLDLKEFAALTEVIYTSANQ
ncbi:16S rRNA (adenine(1518)-N(6)/adenine(1519)-N(6))-dimethyltransferase RsmA [Thermoflavimicrobium daqui]|jgi:16S rRNA (adenine1518-N6/adenine1519-N6)-dimethyltransferase|uniref:Ribosomal RNA small subunit methyltransferase A n=1 Tax=Thermoflavimicrobium daqui TaxID=2137476 RepID=A0A364K363_9BACL|nr:16S rRNA (adenine(1518)-N(6)/adenine(1519)-N(6))-dimethyltransferase RsmA [Thermoflavimicrobium daqui]RAL23166.1 16S rRNA (adenine(1518)-N(6)/adenine(1519)-N(6))-dimethyltransferase [Thermoflavimicrobium daqui]